ncbi:hypothetical protein [Streptomyces sp. NPDC090022]|uniref:hypothetical protein n=1 Tax=Streptomyces sp. NPDC090022 TaxID=3365920 RepID=UPI0037F1A2C9
MKLRHVRAVAVFGIAVFALTGARGSHGGSCGGGSSSSGSGSSGGSSGSSSSSGGSTSGDTTSGGSTSSGTSGTSGSDSSSTSGSTSSGSSVPGGSSSNKAERDIKIDKCRLDATGKNLVARLTVTNSGTLDQTYNITVKFRGDAASSVIPATARVSGLKVKAGATSQTEATTAYTGKGDGSEYKECSVFTASKSSL